MNFFNKITFTILILSFIFGCDSKHGLEDHQNGQNRTFEVSSIKASSQISKTNSYRIPTEKLYNFEACLKDFLHNKDIKNQEFEITDGQNSITTARSSEKGCIFWSERISYNFLDSSKYLTIERFIRSKGIHAGAQKLNLALNPWIHGEKIDEVVDLRRKAVPAKLNFHQSKNILTAKSLSQKVPIYLSEINLLITEANYDDVMFYDVQLQSPLEVFLKNTKNNDVLVEIEGGKYSLDFYLVHQDGDNKAILTRSTNIEAKNELGNLFARFPIQLNKIPTTGFLRALVKIRPQDKTIGLSQGEILFPLGIAGEITGNKKGKPFGFVKNAKGHYNSLAYIDPSKKNNINFDTGYIKAGVRVKENLKIRFKRFSNETTAERNVDFEITACLERTDGKNIGLRNIEVHKIKTDESGKRIIRMRPLQRSACLTWEDSLRHKYFIPERKILKTFILKNKDIGLDTEVPILLNPWDFGWTFATDARIQEEESIIKERTEQRESSKFFLRNYMYKEQNVSYTIDDQLRIFQVSKFKFSLDPYVERPSSQTGGRNQVEGLRKGQYLIRILIRRNDIEDPEAAREYITHAQTITTVTKGILTADVDLVFPKQDILRSRNRILIELALVNEDKIEPVTDVLFKPKDGYTYDDVIDYDSGLEPAIFEGPIIVAGAKDSNRVEPFRLEDFELLKLRMKKRYEESLPDNYVEDHLLPIESDQLTLRALIELGRAKAATELNRDRLLQVAYTKHHRLKEIHTNHTDQNMTFLKSIKDQKWSKKIKDKKFKMTPQLLDQFIDQPHKYTTLKKHFCNYFIDKLIDQRVFNNTSFMGTDRNIIRNNCLLSTSPLFSSNFLYDEEGHPKYKNMRKVIDYINGTPAFSFTRQYLPKKSKHLDHISGYSYGYGIRTGYSLSKSFSISQNLNSGFKFPIPDNLFGISAGGSLGAGWRKSRSSSTSTGFSVSVDIEENVESIRLYQPQKCLVMRFNPIFINRMFSELFRSIESEPFSDMIKSNIYKAGLLICKEMDKEYIDKNEHYYYLEQKQGPSTFQDVTNIRNRPIRLKVRGRNEFYRFIEHLEGSLTYPDSINPQGDFFANIFDYMKLNIENVPFNYPGIYTDVDESIRLFRSYYVPNK